MRDFNMKAEHHKSLFLLWWNMILFRLAHSLSQALLTHSYQLFQTTVSFFFLSQTHSSKHWSLPNSTFIRLNLFRSRSLISRLLGMYITVGSTKRSFISNIFVCDHLNNILEGSHSHFKPDCYHSALYFLHWSNMLSNIKICLSTALR